MHEISRAIRILLLFRIRCTLSVRIRCTKFLAIIFIVLHAATLSIRIRCPTHLHVSLQRRRELQ